MKWHSSLTNLMSTNEPPCVVWSILTYHPQNEEVFKSDNLRICTLFVPVFWFSANPYSSALIKKIIYRDHLMYLINSGDGSAFVNTRQFKLNTVLNAWIVTKTSNHHFLERTCRESSTKHSTAHHRHESVKSGSRWRVPSQVSKWIHMICWRSFSITNMIWSFISNNMTNNIQVRARSPLSFQTAALGLFGVSHITFSKCITKIFRWSSQNYSKRRVE